MTPALLTVAQVAQRLALSTTAVYSLCDSGELEHHRVGVGAKRKRYRVSPDALESYIAATKVSAPPVLALPRRRGRLGESSVAGCPRLRAAGWKG